MMKCYFTQEGQLFKLSNELIERTWRYSEGRFYTTSILNKLNGYEWLGVDFSPEFFYQGLTGIMNRKAQPFKMELTGLEVNEIKSSLYSSPYLEVTFNFNDLLHGVEVQRIAMIYENAPAIRSYLKVRSKNMPMGDFYAGDRFNILDSFPVNTRKLSLTSYEFYTRTDNTDHLVEERNNPNDFDRGNLFFGQDTESCNGFFILKESPCFSDQRPETTGNYYLEDGNIYTLGWGIRPEEFPLGKSIQTYSSVCGVFNESREYGILALKQYQREKAPLIPERDYMVMANPWGDRHCMEHMGESFVLKELEACSLLGITHYQLDDGWEKGNGLAHIQDNEVVETDFWEIDPVRFPDGFYKVAEKAEECGVELGLWFAPDRNRLFRDYIQQAELLYEMYCKYGIKKFKIDIIQIRNKESEDNLEKLMILLKEKTAGNVAFNLDITLDPRAGYFLFQEYGNLFLENRYTDWKNYYPYLTLKNLWDLSRFVPPQKLQIEFLNIDRNANRYDSNDVLAPFNYSYEYVFAVTMFSNPLCWFEPSALREPALSRFQEMIQLHKKYRNGIFDGHIFPVGERPSGYSWTGFQSHRNDFNRGFLIVYREYHPKSVYRIKPLFLEGKSFSLKSLSDDSGDIEVTNYKNEGISITLESMNSFRLYQYEILIKKPSILAGLFL